MNIKKLTVVSATLAGIAGIAALAAFTNPVRVFRTYAAALGAPATSNQVFATEIDCGSSATDLVVYDKLIPSGHTYRC